MFRSLYKFTFTKTKFISELTQSVKEFNQSGALTNLLPRQYKQDSFEAFKISDDLRCLTQQLSDPIYDLVDRGGKRWRPALCFVIAELFNKPHSDVYEVAAIVELIHNGTLIVDDIEDDSPVRRNKPCVHLIYGVDTAINAGNFIYFAPLYHLLNSNKYSGEIKLQMLKICITNMTVVHFGQAWDIGWHKGDKNTSLPTEDQYFSMAEYKTGALVKMAARLSCLVLGQQDEIGIKLADFASKIGIAFQIQDDILNLIGNQSYKQTKGYLGEDIHEGKLSLIMIHSLQRQSNDRLLNILRSKTSDQGEIQEAINLVKQTNSIKYGQEISQKLIDDAWRSVENIFEESDSKIKLKQFASYLIERDL